MTNKNNIHADLLAAQKIAYEPNGLFCNSIIQDAESQEYGACTFTINNKITTFRVAKITPIKIGQFVTLWKRIGHGPIMPYDLADSIDLFVISVRSAMHFGQFIFPKSILFQQKILSKNGIGGKRGIRVYPPWDITSNPQAKKSQAWQLEFFVEFQPALDTKSIQRLLRQN